MNSELKDVTPAPRGVESLKLPRWQVLVLLVGFPVLYWLNTVTPWSYGLFVQRDHRYFLPFGVSVTVLHWTSLATALFFVRQAGRGLSGCDIEKKW